MSIICFFETIFFIVIYSFLFRDLVRALKKKDDMGIKVQFVKIFIAIIITIALYWFNP